MARAEAQSGEITALLRAWQAGDDRAGALLFERLYPELRAVVARQLARADRPFVETRDVLHEAYLRIARQRGAQWLSRPHFFAVSALVVRRVVVDLARRKRRLKRGAGLTVALSEAAAPAAPAPIDVLGLDRALAALAERNPTSARLVDLRFFGGLTLDEAAQVMELSRATVVRTWRVARAFLAERLLAEQARHGA